MFWTDTWKPFPSVDVSSVANWPWASFLGVRTVILFLWRIYPMVKLLSQPSLLPCRCVLSQITGCRSCAVPCATLCEAQAGITSGRPTQIPARQQSAQLLVWEKPEAEQHHKEVAKVISSCTHALTCQVHYGSVL